MIAADMNTLRYPRVKSRNFDFRVLDHYAVNFIYIENLINPEFKRMKTL